MAKSGSGRTVKSAPPLKSEYLHIYRAEPEAHLADGFPTSQPSKIDFKIFLGRQPSFIGLN